MAANIERGEFDITYDGKTLTLKETMGPSRTSQEREKKTIGEIYFAARRHDVNCIRELTWMLLQAYHKDEFKNLDDVDKVFDYFGGPSYFFDYLEAIDSHEKAREAEKLEKAIKSKGKKGAKEPANP